MNSSIELAIAQCSFARPATPGETCQCGKPAVIIYEPEGCTATPWCGVDDAERLVVR